MSSGQGGSGGQGGVNRGPGGPMGPGGPAGMPPPGRMGTGSAPINERERMLVMEKERESERVRQQEREIARLKTQREDERKELERLRDNEKQRQEQMRRERIERDAEQARKAREAQVSVCECLSLSSRCNPFRTCFFPCWLSPPFFFWKWVRSDICMLLLVSHVHNPARKGASRARA